MMYSIFHANFDLGVFQESEVTRGIYAMELSWYWVTATEALSPYYSEDEVFYRDAGKFALEAL